MLFNCFIGHKKIGERTEDVNSPQELLRQNESRPCKNNNNNNNRLESRICHWESIGKTEFNLD